MKICLVFAPVVWSILTMLPTLLFLPTAAGDLPMAKKKHKPDKPKKARKAPGRKSESQSPRDLARLLIEEADQQADPDKQAELARQALELDPDSADAYLLLAELSHSRKETLALFQQASAAGERTLGPEVFRSAAGNLGEHPGAEPYLNARCGLAHTLWTLGRRDEAIVQGRELLRQDANDFQGMRFTLAAWLLAQDRDAEVAAIADAYAGEEKLAAWAYTLALLAFRKEGDTEAARKLLKKARKYNKHVADFLLGEEQLPAEQTDGFVPGTPQEAIEYAGGFLPAWRATAGALDFLRDYGKPARKKKAATAPEGPTAAARKRLARLEQTPEIWQVDCRRMPVWIHETARPVRPWSALVLDQATDLLMGQNTTLELPSADEIWELLAQSMEQPITNTPHRPTEVHYPAGRPWEALTEPLADLGITLVARPALAEIDALFPELIERIAGKQPPGLLDVAGVTPELVRRFYEAAAAFYQQAPWRLVGYESAIEVRSDRSESGPWYAVIMGQSGLTLGLALYDSLKVLRRLWSDEGSDEDNARRTVGTSVTFGDPDSIPIADLDASEEYGWPVARSDAYPCVFHKERGLATRPPLAWELELLEGCLRALPDFVRRRPQDDKVPHEATVTTANGPMRLALAWVPDMPQPHEERSRRPPTTDADPLIEAALEHEEMIRSAYEQYADKKPILLYDVQEGRIYAYPFEGFKADLNPRNQAALQQQYELAKQGNQIIVFVRDNEQRRLMSFTLDREP